MSSIDLNSDLGESFGAWTLGDDVAMLALVSSANVACGFHAGDPLTLRRTVAAAERAGVTIALYNAPCGLTYRTRVPAARHKPSSAPN